MNEDLLLLEDWLSFNKLALNVAKTKFMHITNKRNTNKFQSLQINDEIINRESCVKYLGVKIDEKLKLTPHFYFIKAKLGKKLGLLRRIAGQLTKDSKKTFFNAIVAPHFDYCASILFV